MSNENWSDIASPIASASDDWSDVASPVGAAPAKKQNKGIAGDLVTDLKRGVEQLPGIVTGVADIPIAAITGDTYADKAANALGGITGFAPAKWAKDAEAEYSPGRVAAKSNVDQAWEDNKTPFADAAGGDFAGIGQIAKSYVQNPQQLVGSVVESLPSMLGGAKIGQALTKAAGIAAPVVAGAVGEGAVMAGQQMNNLTEAGADPRTAAAASAVTGVVGGAVGAVGGKLAQRMGVVDPDTALAGGATRALAGETGDQTIKGSIKEGAKRIAGGAASEGLFEELPQSALEQVLSNLAQGKPWEEGVGRSAVEGTLAGSLMGAAFNALPGKKEAPATTPPANEQTTIAGLLPAPTYTGTPGEQIIAADAERQAAIDAADTANKKLWEERDAYAKLQEELKRNNITIINDPEPLQQRIDALMGINEARLHGFARTNYEKAIENAFGEQVGIVVGKDGLEVPFTMGDYLKSKTAVGDMERKGQGKKAPSAGIAAPPAIPVVGPLSNVANMAVQSGAHQATVMQQAAAQAAENKTPEGKAGTPAGAQKVATAPAQGPLTEVAAQAPAAKDPASVSAPTQAAPQADQANAPQAGAQAAAPQADSVVGDPFIRTRTDAQLNWLAERGKPELKAAATAEIQQRQGNAYPNLPATNSEIPATAEQSSSVANQEPIKNASPSAATVPAESSEPDAEAIKKQGLPVPEDYKGHLIYQSEMAGGKFMVRKKVGGELVGRGFNTAEEARATVDAVSQPKTDTAQEAKQDKAPVSIDAYQEGRKAAQDGKGKKHVPEGLSSEDAAAWKKGIEDEYGVPESSGKSGQNQMPIKKGAVVDAEIEKRILIAADSIDKLRKADVERVLTQGNLDQKKMAEYIKSKRPDLSGEVDDVMAELQPPQSQPKTDTAPQAAPDQAPAIKLNPERASNLREGFSIEFTGHVGGVFHPGDTAKVIARSKTAIQFEKPDGGTAWLDHDRLDRGQPGGWIVGNSQAEKTEPDEDTRFAKNTIFTADKVAAAKARMKAKLGTMNSGIDPELLIDGMTVAGAFIEAGVRKFSDYAKAMVGDLGDGVKPYLLSFYEAARAYPGLNKLGMDSAESAASQHQALLTPEVKEAAKEVIGQAPKVEKKKPASLGESIKMKADYYGVENIDGYTRSKTGANQDTDYGLKGGIKDEFLADATRYLKAVAKLLEDQGFTAPLDKKGKPMKAVSANEAGPAVSGEVNLNMSAGDFSVFAQVGVSAVRGIGPDHPQGVALMVRAGQKNGMNNWLATDLTAGDLAAWFDKQHQAFAKRSVEVKPAAPAKESYDLSKADDKFKVATEISDFLIGGGEFKTIIEARKKISEMIGRPIEAATELAKQADETIETAVVLAGRDIVKAGRKQGRTPEVIYTRLVDLYRRQPNLAVRSSTSVRDQAYSTPVPLAYLASELAGITYDTKVLEPTAGNGMLLIGASVGNSVVNELNPDRADVLRSLGFNPTERNAATEQLRHAGYPVDAVIANPPFGATKDANGETIVYDIKPGFKTREVDHAIVFKSLETMKDDGRAVLIVGGVQAEAEEARREDYRGANKRSFYFNLYNEYNVIDHFTADGGLYSKQGASYPVDIIVIDGRGKSSRDMPAADLPVIYKSYDALKEKLNGNGRVESEPVVGASGTDSGNGQAGNGDTPAVAGSPVGSSVKDGNGSAAGVSAGGVRNDGTADNGRPSGSGAVSSGGQSESPNASGPVDGVRVSDANRNAEAGSKAGNRGNGSADLGGVSVVNGERVESGLTDRRGKEQETGHQVAYTPHSNAASVGTLVPRAMKDSIAASLQKISDEVGSIDDYVAESLAMDLEDVKANFSAEQIDALALAIRNAEAGKGFIIGDQTGIGKGRVVAAMIRYALVTGKTPIFVTEKPNLYSDMIRDLDDIGMTAELALDTKNPKVLITNGGESIPYTLLRTEKGEVVENNLLLRAPKSGKALDQIMQGMMEGDSLGEYKVIFTTYSQLQTVKGATTTRQKFIRQFGEGNYMVFDESHNAGGAGETQARSKEQRQAAKDGESLVTGRASFVRHLVQKAFGTFFSSATYAKRPDVMDLYSSTNMKLAVDKISQLGEAIKAGGVPMQQVVANMLTKDGQYIRRERTFAGVSYDTQETKVDKVTAENMASAMRSILAFSRAKDSVIKEIQKEMDREGGMINEMGGEKSSVQGANFGSIMHNLIDQMLLSLKVQDSVSHAIERLKAGEKVVLTVSNTMGSFLKDYSEELGIATGDPVSMSFADLYNRYLEKQRNVTIKDGGGNKRQHRLTDAELGPRLVDMFNAVRKQIESSGFGSAPISPIDYMHNELRKAGYKTDEITGRTIALNYSSGTPILASRTANIRQRVKAVSGFNNGETDVLILNQAGSTGLSLHASSKFKDQRKRHMIIVQAEKNIDTHMQMLGRVHRTGQVVAPAYSQMMADIPAEMRPASVLMKKMASLNANTTASRTSSVTAEGVVDFMNNYGGQVVHEYLRDNPDVLEAVGGNKVISLADDPAEAGEDDIRKFTGYIPILPIKQQEEVYRELVDRYNELIERENSLGTNKLEAKAVDLDAETISSQTVTEDRGDPSVFASPANMEKVDVKRTVKPYSSEEVAAMVSESLDGKTANQVAATQLADLFDNATAYGKEKVAKMVADEVDPVKLDSQKAQLQLVLSHARTVLNTYKIGDSISVKDQIGQFVYGVITKIERSGRTANPAAGSAWKMHVALANGDAKSITLSFSQIGSKYELRAENRVEWYNTDTQSVERIPVSDIFDKGAKVRREKRWIVTGNILAGFARFPGQIITYTKNDGATAQGVLMSRQFDFEKEQKNAPVRIKDGKAAIKFFTNGGQGGIIGTPDRFLMIAPRRGEFEITVPSSKKDGGTYYLDTGLTNIVGDFYKRGSIMSASVYTTGDVERVVNYLVKDREETIIALSNVEKAKELLEGNTGAGNIAAPGSISPADKAIYGMSAEGKSAAEILKFIASASRNPFYRQLAKLLQKTGINPTITVGDGKGWKMNAGEGHKYAAAYNPETDTVAMFRPASAERHVLHELMHAASLKALSKKGLSAIQMRALFAHVEKHGKSVGLFYDQKTKRGVYGMANIDEFIAEAFSNPKFQALLKQVSAMPVGGKPSSAWDWFIRVVRGILGLKHGADNALSQALDIGVWVMRENMALQSGDGVIRFNHALRSNPEGNRPLNATRLTELRRIAAGLERPKDAVFLRVTEDGKAITTGPKGVRIPETFIRFAESNGLDFEARRNGESRKSDGHTVGDHITSKTEPMPAEYRESGALYFGEGNEFFDRTGKTRYNAEPGKKSWSANDYQKRADQLDRAFTAMGLESIRESSRASASEYVAVQDPNDEETTYKFRVSNHRLPSGYAQPDFDVIADGVEHDGAMWNASGTWIDAVNWISDKTGKEPTGIVKAMARKRRHEVEEARRTEAVEREKIKAQYSDQNSRIIAEKIKLSDWLDALPQESALSVSNKGRLNATKPSGDVLQYGAKPFGMANSTRTIADARKYVESAPTPNSAATRLLGAPDKAGMQERSKTEPAQSKSGAGSDANVTDSADNGNGIRYNAASGKIKQTDTAAFHKWFGDSKVVDANGKPLVVYHGTKNDFSIFLPDSHFGTKDQADSILSEKRGKIGKQVMPVYLSIQKMKRVKDQEIAQRWADVVATAKRQGYDGLIYKNEFEGDGTQDSYVVFKPEQIKSAIGNNGDFDGSNPDIRYNVTDEGWSITEPSKMDDAIYAMQDKQVDMKRVIQSILKTGKQIKDSLNPYLQEELFHGRASKGVKDFLDFELRPLLREMQQGNIDMGDFEEYLWNAHAQERNEQIAKVNPEMKDGGSGIKTADAKAYLAALSPELRGKYQSLAARVNAINKASQKALVDSGLEKQETIDAWNGAYQHYVPLQREDVDSGHIGTGKGFSIRGSSTKRALGSGRKVVDIIANLTMQRERNIVRAEKNRVTLAVRGLAMDNPNADFWTVDQAPKERVIENKAIYTVMDSEGRPNEFTRMADAEKFARSIPGANIEQTWQDRVTERVVPGFSSRDNVLLARVNGEDKYVIFNERDERAMRMVLSLKNLDMDNMGRVLSLIGKATRYLSAINTQYNPAFGVINLIRDTQGALVNLSSTPLAGEQKRVLGYTTGALIGIYKDIRAHRQGKVPSSNWAALFEEFQKEGGQTGYRDQYANAEARAESIISELKQIKEGKPKQMLRGVFGWLSDYNDTMENAVRLAAYKAAKEKGMSKQQAASLAKNLTVNFNRKGQVATQVGALYAFFNASMQGSARLAQTLFEANDGDIKSVRLSKTGKKIMVGGIMLGSMQALLLAAAGFDDDEPPEFIRERNLILPIGDGKYLTLAMPLGLHVIPGIGRIATEFVLGGGKDPLKHMAAFAGMFAESFNPIGSAGLSLQTIAPSVIDPFAALAENRDFTGKEIYRENRNAMSPTPGHARAKDVATFYSRWISEGLNFITGGTEFKPGMLSWSPDSIDYLVGQVTGGVGREANKVFQTGRAATTGEDLPLYKIPLVGRFVGDTAGQSGESAKFYDAIKQINMHENQMKGLREERRFDEAREYAQENPAVRLIMAGNHAERSIQKLRSLKRDLIKDDADQSKVKAIDDRITAAMKSFNERAATVF